MLQSERLEMRSTEKIGSDQTEADFPNAELGIGECGCTDVKAAIFGDIG